MLVSGLLLGILGIKKGFTRILRFSLMMAGLFMTGMAFSRIALSGSILSICVFGFLFFAMLPLANNCLDYLARTNIPENLQGRAWGFIGFLSQLGYVFAYAVSGIAADGLGLVTEKGVGFGAAMMIGISGVLLFVTAFILLGLPAIRGLEPAE